MDTKVMHSKIPGIKTNEPSLQDKYMEKLFKDQNVIGPLTTTN